MNNYYKKQAEKHRKKWLAAADLGEDKQAAKHKQEYENYIGMVKVWLRNGNEQ